MITLRDETVAHPDGDLRVRLVERGTSRRFAIVITCPAATVATPQPPHYNFEESLACFLRVVEYCRAEAERARED